MKNKKLLLLPFLALILAGCTPNASSSEQSSSEVPSSEVPSSVTPSSEQPSSEVPSSEVPSSEVPSSEQPSSEVPSSEIPSSEDPSSEIPSSSEEPSSEIPSSEIPSSEEPSSEIPSSEIPSSSEDEDTESLPTIPVEVTPKRTIAEIRAMTADGESASAALKELVYETTGVVTAKFRGAVLDKNPAWNISIQQGGAALLLYAIDEETYAADFADVEVGDQLTVEGNIAAYNGLRELDKIKYISHTPAANPIVPEAITSLKQADLKGKDSVLVKIDGLKVIDKPNLVASVDGDRTNITLGVRLALPGDLATTISTYMHYNITFADAEATMEKLSALKSTDTVSWTGILGMNAGLFQMTNANADEWTITAGVEPVAATIAFDKAAFDLDVNEEVLRKLVLTPWDAKTTGVIFASSDEAVATIDAEGNVKGIAAGEATLTATLGALKAETKVTVKATGGVVTKIVVTPFKDALGSDKNAELTTLELFSQYSKGLPEGSTVVGSKFYVGTGGGSSSTDSMPAEYTVFKFSTSKDNGSLTITLPAGTLVESVDVKGRGWNTDAATLAINGVTKDFKNADGANKEDIRDFSYDLPEATNVINFVAVKRAILTEIVFNLKAGGGGEVDPPEPDGEYFGAAIPEGVTPIETILTSAPELGTVFTTRGVVTGTNGGQIMLQDPLSGKGIFGYGTLTNEQKLALKLGVVVDMTGTYAVNNNGKQLAVTAISIVAEENLTKVEAVTISSAAELELIKASTDVNLHSRLVKFVGVKIVSANTDKKSFVITFGGEDSQYIAVGFMDSASAEKKSRDEINALALELLENETVFDLYAVQNAGAASGSLVWNFNSPTLDYIVVKPVVVEGEYFGAAIPEGVTPIETILTSAPELGTVFTTRGVVIGTNGGQIMLQDPLSGKGIFGYGTLTNEQKLALKLGVVVDMTGTYAVNNNGKQLAVTGISVVAEENLTKVTAITISSVAELELIKASTDVNLHSRLVKFVGVKIVSANTDKKSFVITFGGEDSQYIAVGFMDSANADKKSRDEINAFALQLLENETVFDLYAVQNAGAASGSLVWNFNSPTLDYFVVA